MLVRPRKAESRRQMNRWYFWVLGPVMLATGLGLPFIVHPPSWQGHVVLYVVCGTLVRRLSVSQTPCVFIGRSAPLLGQSSSRTWRMSPTKRWLGGAASHSGSGRVDLPATSSTRSPVSRYSAYPHSTSCSGVDLARPSMPCWTSRGGQATMSPELDPVEQSAEADEARA